MAEKNDRLLFTPTVRVTEKQVRVTIVVYSSGTKKRGAASADIGPGGVAAASQAALRAAFKSVGEDLDVLIENDKARQKERAEMKR